MAQQARPNVAGHIEFFLAHATAFPTVVSRIPRRASSSASWADPATTAPGRRCTGMASGPPPGRLGHWLAHGPLARRTLDDRRERRKGARPDLTPLPMRPFPFEAALLPHVQVGHEDQPDEHDHLDETEQAQ